jgi:hypothetical protein
MIAVAGSHLNDPFDPSSSAKAETWFVSKISCPSFNNVRSDLDLVIQRASNTDGAVAGLVELLQQSLPAMATSTLFTAHNPVSKLISGTVEGNLAVALNDGSADPLLLLFGAAASHGIHRSDAAQAQVASHPILGSLLTSPHPPAATPSSALDTPVARQFHDPQSLLVLHLCWACGLAQRNAVRDWFQQHEPGFWPGHHSIFQPAAPPPPATLLADATLSFLAAVLARCKREQQCSPSPTTSPQPSLPQSQQPQPEASSRPGLQLLAAELLVRMLAQQPAALHSSVELSDKLLPGLLHATELLLDHSTAPQHSASRSSSSCSSPTAPPTTTAEAADSTIACPPSPRTPSAHPSTPTAFLDRATAHQRLQQLCAALEHRRTLYSLLPVALETEQPSACTAAALLRLLTRLYQGQLLRDPCPLPLVLQHMQCLWSATAGYTRPNTFEPLAAQLESDLAAVLACFRPQVRCTNSITLAACWQNPAACLRQLMRITSCNHAPTLQGFRVAATQRTYTLAAAAL